MDFFGRNTILGNTTVYRYNVKYKDGEYYVLADVLFAAEKKKSEQN